ncbi:MAG: hypothetical protein OEW19_19995 [Acidobacteriota bacterium]|nr:hypothetical protein [Acidobacteriota bacterium]
MVEIGLLLVLIPWSRFWERNYFGLLVPAVQAIMTNNFVRGAVSGLGLINLWIAVAELTAVVGGRTGDSASSTRGHG